MTDFQADHIIEEEIEELDLGGPVAIIEEEIEELDLDMNGPVAAAVTILPAIPAGRFDYGTIAGSSRRDAEQAAERIRALYSGMVANRAEIGRELIEIRGKLAHGEFGLWVKGEFYWSERSAYNYMDLAKALALDKRLAILPDAALHLIGADKTPADVKQKVIEGVVAGKPLDTRSVALLIKEAKGKAAKLETKTRGKTPEEVKKIVAAAAKAEAKRKAKGEAEAAAAKKQNEEFERAAESAVALLKTHLGSEFSEFQRLFGEAGTFHFRQAMGRSPIPDTPSNVIALPR